MRKLLVLIPALLFVVSSVAAAGPIAFVTMSSRQFGTIDLGTGAVTPVGSTPTVLAGIAATPAGQIYGVDAGSNLVLINTSNASTTTVGNTSQSLVVFGGLTTGALYALDFSNNLYSVNSTTDAATFVGSTGLTPIPADGQFANGFAGDDTTLYYSYQIYADINHPALASGLYAINPATAATTLIGPTATDATTGLGFYNGALFGPGQVGPNLNLYQFNSGSGAATFVGPITGASGLVYGIAAPVPEPMTMSMVGAGVLLGLRRRLRARR